MGPLFFLFWGSFVLALSGAMMPGPMLTATVSEAVKRGAIAGPLIVLGHALLEITLLVALVAGLATWLTHDLVLAILSLAGGLILVGMGLHMVVTSGKAAEQALNAVADARAAIRGPVLAGVLTSLANPYWTVWWATLGLGYAAFALQRGLPGLASFYTGHILGDLGWYCIVATAVASSRKVCPPRVYRGVLIFCGVALVGLGTWFLVSGTGRLLPD